MKSNKIKYAHAIVVFLELYQQQPVYQSYKWNQAETKSKNNCKKYDVFLPQIKIVYM